MEKEIKELVENLRWLLSALPSISDPEDAVDKLLILNRIYCKEAADKLEELSSKLHYQEINDNMTAVDFRNELVNRLNNNATRYNGGVCTIDNIEYPEVQTFEVDEVYEIIDRVLDGIPEDNGEVD